MSYILSSIFKEYGLFVELIVDVFYHVQYRHLQDNCSLFTHGGIVRYIHACMDGMHGCIYRVKNIKYEL